MTTRPHRIGVDTGGTFTDLVLVDAGGEVIATHKLPSTPDDPARAVLQGVEALLHKIDINTKPTRVVHGSTVATNALLESDTSEGTLFITTAGFEDTLRIARQDRPELYALVPRRPDPPIAPDACLGVDQRMSHTGDVLTKLTDAALADLVQKVRQRRPASIAISLLHSYANPTHETRIAQALRDALGDELHLTLSHRLLPEHREYERAATCVINAVVAPRMGRYLARLSDQLGRDALRIMGSHGGTLPVDAVLDQPVRTVLSGPAGGVLGALAAANQAGIDRIITLDMGGTSTDVALCEGAPVLSTEGEAAGLPVRLPMIQMHTVGAGGGSIAEVDPGGALRVGPRSTGADPGPACYGKQTPGSSPKNFIPTVTDAHAVLGHLPADQPLAGGLTLDLAAARAAIARLAEQANLSEPETAEGILRVAEVTMGRAVQRISLQRGKDPRPCTLVPFGGAGGLHACRLAESLGITRVLVPRGGGVLSAVGMLTAPAKRTDAQAVMQQIPADDDAPLADHPAVAAAFEALTGRAADLPHHTRELDLRYAGQSYEITVPMDRGDPLRAFTEEHRRLYGYTPDRRSIQIVTARLTVADDAPQTRWPALSKSSLEMPEPDAQGWRRYDREKLGAGDRLTAPAIITEPTATTLVPAGWSANVNEHGQLLLMLSKEDSRT